MTKDGEIENESKSQEENVCKGMSIFECFFVCVQSNF